MQLNLKMPIFAIKNIFNMKKIELIFDAKQTFGIDFDADAIVSSILDGNYSITINMRKNRLPSEIVKIVCCVCKKMEEKENTWFQIDKDDEEVIYGGCEENGDLPIAQITYLLISTK